MVNLLKKSFLLLLTSSKLNSSSIFPPLSSRSLNTINLKDSLTLFQLRTNVVVHKSIFFQNLYCLTMLTSLNGQCNNCTKQVPFFTELKRSKFLASTTYGTFRTTDLDRLFDNNAQIYLLVDCSRRKGILILSFLVYKNRSFGVSLIRNN